MYIKLQSKLIKLKSDLFQERLLFLFQKCLKFDKILNRKDELEVLLMGKIISLVNQKGGVGKTTTSINLAASLGELGKKVLIIDLDPQGNTTTGVGINKGDFEKSVYDLLISDIDPNSVIIKTEFTNLSVIPAKINLAGVDIELIEKANKDSNFAKVGQLKKAIMNITADYDYIIIDCPPSLGLLTTNALTASHSVIIPVQCEFFALEGVVQLLSTINLARKNLNPKLNIEGVLLTMLDGRTLAGQEVATDIRSWFEDAVYDTIIPRLVRLSEAPSHGKPIIAYDPNSKGSVAYINLAKEVIARNGS